jgi:phenylalanyl-tRNA synthetase alpha chain
MNPLDEIVEAARAAFVQAQTPAELENAKAVFLGKSGQLTDLMKGLASLPVDEKKTRGAAINLTKQACGVGADRQTSGHGRC